MRVEPRNFRRAPKPKATATAPLVTAARKPVRKTYGAKSAYQPIGESAYEQRRAARKAARWLP